MHSFRRRAGSTAASRPRTTSLNSTARPVRPPTSTIVAFDANPGFRWPGRPFTAGARRARHGHRSRAPLRQSLRAGRARPVPVERAGRVDTVILSVEQCQAPQATRDTAGRAARKRAFEAEFGDWMAAQNVRFESQGVPGADLRPWWAARGRQRRLREHESKRVRRHSPHRRDADRAARRPRGGCQRKSSSRWWRAPSTSTSSGVRMSKRSTYPVEPNGTMSSRSVARGPTLR